MAKKKSKIIQKLNEELNFYKEQYAKNSKMEEQFREELKIALENKMKLIGAISAIKKVLKED